MMMMMMVIIIILLGSMLSGCGLKVCSKVSGISYFFDNDLSDTKHF